MSCPISVSPHSPSYVLSGGGGGGVMNGVPVAWLKWMWYSLRIKLKTALGSVTLQVVPSSLATSIHVISPPRVDGLRYLQRSRQHTLVTSAFSMHRTTFAISSLPVRGWLAALSWRNSDQWCRVASFRIVWVPWRFKLCRPQHWLLQYVWYLLLRLTVWDICKAVAGYLGHFSLFNAPDYFCNFFIACEGFSGCSFLKKFGSVSCGMCGIILNCSDCFLCILELCKYIFFYRSMSRSILQ